MAIRTEISAYVQSRDNRDLPETQAKLTRIQWEKPDQMKNALQTFGLWFAFTFAAIFVPIIHWVAVPGHCTDAPVREFGAMTDDLHAMAEWLLACGVDVVALESTGVYWIPVYELLESRGLKVWLVDARQARRSRTEKNCRHDAHPPC